MERGRAATEDGARQPPVVAATGGPTEGQLPTDRAHHVAGKGVLSDEGHQLGLIVVSAPGRGAVLSPWRCRPFFGSSAADLEAIVELTRRTLGKGVQLMKGRSWT